MANAVAVTIPSTIASVPCLSTGKRILSAPIGRAKILRICQRPADPTVVDIHYELAYSGEWVYDLWGSGYKVGSQWYMLKPGTGDVLHDGTAVMAETSPGTWGTTKLNNTIKQQHVFVWDAAEYTDFLKDPDIDMCLAFQQYSNSQYFAYTAEPHTADNNGATQVAVSNPQGSYLSGDLLCETFQKGVTSPPYTVSVGTEGVRFTFSPDITGICACTSVCGDLSSPALCVDNSNYLIDILNSTIISGEVISQLVSFDDALTNTTEISAIALHNVTPDAPTPTYSNPTTSVLIAFTGSVAGDLSTYTDTIKLERYIGSENNRTLVKDWLEVTGESITVPDANPLSGKTYGYRVKLRTLQHSATQWSAWSTVSI